MERFHCLCHTFLCVNTLCVCVCAYVGWVGVCGLASNVDCTGMFIEYMYAHLHNICMCLLQILCSHLLFTRGLHCVTYCLFC